MLMLAVAAIQSTAWLAGCSDTPAGVKPIDSTSTKPVDSTSVGGGISIPPTTKILDSNTALSLLRVDSTTLTFAASPAMSKIASGDIVVAGITTKTPYGLLRKVVSVQSTSSGVVLTTTSATVADAIENGSVHFSDVQLTRSTASSSRANAAGLSHPSLTTAPFVFSTPHLELSPHVALGADAEIALGISGDVRIANHQVELLSVTVGATSSVSAKVTVTAAETLSIPSKTITTWPDVDPFVVFIGPFPLVLVPTVDLNLSGSIGMNGGLTASLSRSDNVTAGIKYEAGAVTPFATHSHSPPTWSVGATAEGDVTLRLGPEVSLSPFFSRSILNAAGVDASVSVEPDLLLHPTVHFFTDPWWELFGGVSVTRRFDLRLWNLQLVSDATETFRAEVRLAEGGSRIALAPSTVTLAAGQTATMHASVFSDDTLHVPLPVVNSHGGRAIHWLSRTPSIDTVVADVIDSENATITARSVGQSWIIAWTVKPGDPATPTDTIEAIDSVLTTVSAKACNPGPLENGRTQLGCIIAPLQRDVWTFTANAGDYFVVGVGASHPTGRYTTGFVVAGPDGKVIGLDQNSNPGGIARRIAGNAPTMGVYTVTVDDFNETGTADYQITLNKTGAPLSPSSSDDGGALIAGSTQSGHIGYAGDVDAWTFTANAGDYFSVGIGATNPTGSYTTGFVVAGPDGKVVGVDQNSVAGGIARRVDGNAPVSGVYTVFVDDFNETGTADYRITLNKTGADGQVSSGDEGGMLTPGATHLGHIGYAGDVDGWTFTANAGDYVSVGIGASNLTSRFTTGFVVVRPDGRVFGLDQNSVAGGIARRVDGNTPISGVYLVLVSDFNETGTADYQVTVNKSGSPLTVSAGDDAGSLSSGAPQTGRIGYPGDIDAWTFSASVGDTVAVTVNNTNLTSRFATGLAVIAPDGTVFSASNLGSSGAIKRVAAAAGTYTVIVDDFNETGTADYQLLLNIVPGKKSNLIARPGPTLRSIRIPPR